MDNNKTINIQIRIQRRNGPDINIEQVVEPMHADWLWDLFDVPREERTNQLILTAPISALQILRNTK